MAGCHSWNAIPKVSHPKGQEAIGLFRVYPNPNLNPKILNLIILGSNFPKDILGYDNFLKKRL